MIHVSLENSFDSWRDQARQLLRASVAPDQVRWLSADDKQATLFNAGEPHATTSREDHDSTTTPADEDNLNSPLIVPREFIELASIVACHREPQRWSLLYRVLYRLTHGEKNLIKIEVDDDIRLCRMMAKSVQRDLHKMKAFVRFRHLERGGQDVYVAWHRPDHYITKRIAPWFANRFGSMCWSILTPDASAHWDLTTLSFGAGVQRSEANLADDQLEDLWLTYYASIFNPARLKTKTMIKELPVRHWATLPEARLIPELVRQAARREDMMRESQPASAASFLPPPAARSYAALKETINACRGCELYCTATQPVFGSGDLKASVMFVGEQPGDEEDWQGRPFVGPAGQVLDKALTEVGIDRAQLYLTNAVKHFKYVLRGDLRQHRNPDATEVAACQPWLDAEIDVIQPRLIVCLGATAALSVLGIKLKILDHRGRFYRHPSGAEVFVTVHPSYVLRSGIGQHQEHERFVADLRLVRDWLAARSHNTAVQSTT